MQELNDHIVKLESKYAALQAERDALREACRYALLALTDASEIDSDRRAAIQLCREALKGKP